MKISSSGRKAAEILTGAAIFCALLVLIPEQASFDAISLMILLFPSLFFAALYGTVWAFGFMIVALILAILISLAGFAQPPLPQHVSVAAATYILAALALGALRSTRTGTIARLLSRLRELTRDNHRLARQVEVLRRVNLEFEDRVVKTSDTFLSIHNRLEELYSGTPQEILEVLGDLLQLYGKVNSLVIYTIDRDEEMLIPTVVRRAEDDGKKPLALSAAEGPAGWVFRNGLSLSLRRMDEVEKTGFENLGESLMLYPLRNHQLPYAVISIEGMDVYRFSATTEIQFNIILNLVEPFIERSILRDLHFTQSEVDEVSGLPNYSSFLNEMERTAAECAGTSRVFSLILLELHDYQTSEIQLNKKAGKILLKDLAAAISRTLQTGCSIYHYKESDQLAIILEDMDDAVVLQGYSILGMLNQGQFNYDGRPVSLQGRIGFSSFIQSMQDSTTMIRESEDLIQMQKDVL